jgi:hypothetical protein
MTLTSTARFHLHRGWAKAVLKMEMVPKESRKSVVLLGHALLYPLCAGFVIVPLYLYAQQQPQMAAALGWPLLSLENVVNATGGETAKCHLFLFWSSDCA